MSSSDRPLRVMVVEDDPDLRPTIADLLLIEGFEVDTAVHGAAALAQLRDGHRRPDVILLDWLMPVMNGAEFLSAFTADARFAGVPIVVLSGARDIEQQLAGHERVVRALPKPFAIGPMIDALREACAPKEG